MRISLVMVCIGGALLRLGRPYYSIAPILFLIMPTHPCRTGRQRAACSNEVAATRRFQVH